MRFYSDKEKGNCLHKNKILLNNRGWTEVSGISMAYDNTLFSITSGIKALKQGEAKEIEVKLLDTAHIDPGTAATIMIEVGGQKYPVSTEFYYCPAWALILDGEEVLPDNVQKLYQFSDFTEVPFRLEKSKTTVFEIENVYIEDSRYQVEIANWGEHHVGGVLKLENEKLPIGRKEFVEFVVKGKDTDYVGRYPFYISLVVPPDFFLMFKGTRCREGRWEEIDIYEGIENEIELKIINSSTEPLTIESIDASPPFNILESGVNFPWELPAGSDQLLNLNLDTQIMEEEKGEASILINTRQIKPKKVEFLIEKRVAEYFDGILAVDFGTTNTTIAYKTGEEISFVPLEKKFSDMGKAALSPSVIRYDRVVEQIPEKYVIGELARSLMIFYPRSSVRSIKTSLGKKEEIRIIPVEENCGPTAFSAVKVTSHIIQRLKKIAENHLKKKIIKAVISHPSKFTHIQIEELKTAFKMARISIEDVIEEPEATAISYIIKKKEKIDREGSYVIGVFDCGGGTTDITMIEVFEKRKDQERNLDVKVLATDGDRNFGGNNLTEIMMDILMEKINNGNIEFEKEYNEVEGLRFYYTPADEGDEQMNKIMIPKGIDWDRVVMYNRSWLWDLAETCKIELSNNETTVIDKSSAINFVNKDDDLVQLNVRFQIERREFEERINDKFVKFVEKLKRMENKTVKDFDIIILSGMSSKIPLIYQVFSEHFEGRIEYADDLKKCVVLGAIDYYEKTYAPGLVTLNFNRVAQLRSAIGIMMVDTNGKKKFCEVFPQGTQIPTQPVKVNLPLKKTMRVMVYRNLGTREYIDEAPEEFEEIKRMEIKIPDKVDARKIKEGDMYLQVDEKFKPKISIQIGDFLKDFY
jgi:molecular chaperone DnaK (HSP70)